MNRMLKVAGAALSLALASVAGAAQAAVYTITITGTVIVSHNGDGLFGGGDLTGRAARSVFQIDTSKGFFTDSGSQQAYGGIAPDSPVSSAFEIIGEAPYSLNDPLESGRIEISEFGGGADQFQVNSGFNGQGPSFAFSAFHDFYAYSAIGALSAFDFVNLPDFTAVPDIQAAGSFSIVSHIPGAKGPESRQTTAIIYRPESFTVTPAAAVPEPQIWAMLVIGFGVTGVALQQGRRARANAALAA